MIEVELPDGTIAEFPEGTPQDVIKGALQKRFGGGQQQATPAPEPEPKGMGQRVGEFFMGDDDPTTQNTGEKIGTWLNKAGESMTFGLIGDEASAAVESLAPGVEYGDRRDHYRQQEELLEESNPGAALAADIGGAMVLPGRVAMSGGNMAMRALKSGAVTGAGSGLYGFAEGEGGVQQRADDAVGSAGIGGLIGLGVPFAGGAVGRVANSMKKGQAIRQAAKGAPSTDALRAQGQQAYKAIDESGVQIRPEAFGRLREQLGQTLQREGLDQLPGPGSLTPKSARVMQIADEMGGAMGNEPTAALPFRSLDQLRRHAGTAASDMANKTDSRLGSEAVSQIDEFVARLKPNDVTSGDLQTLQDTIPKARDLWARMSRSGQIDDAIEASENYLSGKASGIRNQFRRILGNKKLARGFSDTEKELMRRAVNGSIPEQLLNLLSSGIGQIGTIGLGAGAGGPVGAMAGAVVAGGARRGAESVAERNAEIVRAIIANGGMQRAPQANPAIRDLTETLMRRGTAVSRQ